MCCVDETGSGRLFEDCQVPELTGLQFLVVAILFDGAMTSSKLHAELVRLGYTDKQDSFSRLMKRLIKASIVSYTPRQLWTGKEKDVAYIKQQHVYRGTDLGLVLWQKAQKFYSQMKPPSDDYAPDEVMGAKFADCGPKERLKLEQDQFVEVFMNLMGQEMPDSWRGLQ